MPGFPSGQRGWTQDPLRNASQVRILPPAPRFTDLRVPLAHRWSRIETPDFLEILSQ